MYDYGREIYSILEDIFSLLEAWQNSWSQAQTSWTNFFELFYENSFSVLLFISVVLALFFVTRFFFPDSRG